MKTVLKVKTQQIKTLIFNLFFQVNIIKYQFRFKIEIKYEMNFLSD